ncbi:MAG: alpha/beta fold hydrolase [Candidatus Acidiferrales bacterium]
MRKALLSYLLLFTCLSLLAVSTLCAQAPVAPAPDPEAHARGIIADMATGRFDAVESQYTADMAAALPKGKLGESWGMLTSQVGAFKGVTDSNLKIVQGLQVVTLHCKFERATIEAVLAFDTDGKLAGLHFSPPETAAAWAPPAYANPTTFKEQPVTVTFSHWQLPGTLTMPTGAGPFPGVVLVQGSGPQDEDETIVGNKPFKDLAWGLASHGIAVLRYEKRTKQYGNASADDFTKMTVSDETINDARAAVALLASQPGIDAHHIYVLGHSLGAYLGPRIAAGDAQVAGLILLAGNTRPIEQVALEMVRYLVGVDQLPPDEAQKEVEEVQAEEKDIERPDLKPSDSVTLLGAQMYGAYWLDLRGYDPAAVAAQLSIPTLILQGERDYQVTMADYDGWKKGLARHANVTFKSYPDLNHLFISGSGTPSAREYRLAGHVSGDVIGDVAAWIAAASKAK